MPGWLRGRDALLSIGAIGLVLVVLVVTRLPHLGTGPLDFDEGVYWLSMRSMRAGNALFSSVYSSQPPGFLMLTEPPWNWLGGSIEAGRAVMVAWGVVGVAAGAVAGWSLCGRFVGVMTAVVLSVDPRMVDQSVILQADGPATALALVSLAAAALTIRLRRRARANTAATLCGAAIALGCLTKLFDVGALPAIALVLVTGRPRREAWAFVATGALVTSLAVILPVMPAWAAMWSEAVGLHLDTGRLYAGPTLGQLGQVLATEWPVAVAAAAGALCGWWGRRRAWTVGMAWLVGSVAALAATRPLYPHHFILVIPGLALLSALGTEAIARAVRRRLRGRPRVVVTVAGSALLAAGAALLLGAALGALQAPTDAALVARIAALTPPAALVLGDNQFDQALAARDSPPQYVDTSGVRLHGGDVTAATLEDALDSDPRVCAVLFATGRLSGIPGFTAWVALHFPDHTALPDGAEFDRRPPCAA